MPDPRHLKFSGSGANWMKMTSILALRLGGYQPLMAGAVVSIATIEPGLSCFASPERVAAGEFDIAISTPVWVGALAAQGKPPFAGKLPISSLACFPHDDRLVFAVRRETGLRSFTDIKDRRFALRISTPPPKTRHPAVWGAEKGTRGIRYQLCRYRKLGRRDPARPATRYLQAKRTTLDRSEFYRDLR